MEFISSKLSKIKNKKKWFFMFLVFIIILIIPSFFVTTHSNMYANLYCERTELDEKSCQFKCIITPKYNTLKETASIQTRIIVIHSFWTAIFDKTYEFNVDNENNFTFQIPRRDYNYHIYVSMWDNKKNIGAINESYPIFC